ncbi:MAG: creatininase family protein [Chloroflexota bacterium]
MQIHDMNWGQVEEYLKRDDRCVVPLGSTEQHAYLRLTVDKILAERMAVESAEPFGIPVFPVLSYGITPYFTGYPGTVSLRTTTYLAIIRDILDGLRAQGFRRILFINGHGGNSPAGNYAVEWMADNPDTTVRFHNWWNAPKTTAKCKEIDAVGSHASWMENFPWTRLPDSDMPTTAKDMISIPLLVTMAPDAVREYLGDGNFGGLYQRPDEDMLAIWDVAVAETREQLTENW